METSSCFLRSSQSYTPLQERCCNEAPTKKEDPYPEEALEIRCPCLDQGVLFILAVTMNREWIWWIDHKLLRHKIRLLCQYEVWQFGRYGYTWDEAGRIIK